MEYPQNWRPTPEALDAIERDLDAPPPPPPEPEFVNGAIRSFTGRFMSETAPILCDYVRNSGPLDALRAAVRLCEKADELTGEAVRIARAHEWPWRDIGQMLGISASAAYRRYGHKEEGPA